MDISSAVVSFFSNILNLLPNSPFLVLRTMQNSDFAQILSFVNWFIPVGTLIDILNGWLACVLVYYAYQIVLRWIKAVQ